MYLSFYHLKHKPFQISTDPRFLWLGEKHEEALATLRYGVLDNKGFLLLTGDVGTGKTTLLNALIRTLDKNTYVAFLRDPALEQLDFFQYIAHAFGMKIDNINTKVAFLIQFEKFLQDAYASKRKVLLIIDEAQRMNQELLEEVRLLSNIEREESKLLNIFFVGQIEFNDIIHHPENRAIRQRITVNYNIEALSEEETRKYIKHRLEIASSKEDIGFFTPVQKKESGEYVRQGLRLPLPEVREEIFTRDAIKEIHSFSKGYPRLINIICDRALLTGFVEESKSISLKHIKECVQELEIPHNKEKIVVRQKSVASLKNSLEQLNREFEEKRRLEALQQRQHEDSPRDLIKRLENADKNNDEFIEAQNDTSNLQDITIRNSEAFKPLENDRSEETDRGKEETAGDFHNDPEPSKDIHHQQSSPDNDVNAEIKDTRDLLDELSKAANFESDTTNVSIPASESSSIDNEHTQEITAGEKNRRKLIVVGLIFAVIIYTFNLLTTEDTSEHKKNIKKEISSNTTTSTLEKSQDQKFVPATDINTPNTPQEPPQTLQSSNLKKKPNENSKTDEDNRSAAQNKTSTDQAPTSYPVKIAPDLLVNNPKTATTNGQVFATHTTDRYPNSDSDQLKNGNNTEQITDRIQQLKSLITFERLFIPFPSDSSLPKIDSLETLNQLVESLLQHPSFDVTLTYLVNPQKNSSEIDKLSEFRANAIKSYLMGRGLVDSRIKINRIDEAELPEQDSVALKSDIKERWVAIDVNR